MIQVIIASIGLTPGAKINQTLTTQILQFGNKNWQHVLSSLLKDFLQRTTTKHTANKLFLLSKFTSMNKI